MVGSLRPMDTGRRTEHCAHGGRAVKAAALPGELDATATSSAPRGGGQGRRIAPSESELVSAVRCRERDHGSPPQLNFFPLILPGWVAAGRKEQEAARKKPTAKGEQPLCRLRPPMEMETAAAAYVPLRCVVRAERSVHGLLVAFPALTGFRAGDRGEGEADGSGSRGGERCFDIWRRAFPVMHRRH